MEWDTHPFEERGHALIPKEDIQKVREATDLVSLVSERVPVKQKGREFWCCCPLHHEKTPSFKMDPSTQLWHCFGCGEGGGVFDIVMKLDDLSFPEAVRKLAERSHIEIHETQGDINGPGRQALKEVCKEAADFYHMQLMRGRGEGPDSAREYLASRGFGGQVPKDWNLGYAPGGGSLVHHLSAKGFKAKEMLEANLAVSKNGRLQDRFYRRIMFPIRDASGDTIAFGGRTMTDSGPKYLNSQETPIFHKSNVLFGLDTAKAAMTSTGRAIVTEGYTDVISMQEAGLQNTVAALGTSLTKEHVRALTRHAGKSIVYIFDGDEAGQRATERALQFIDQAITPEHGSKMRDFRALCLPDGQDPAEFLALHGADEMRTLIDEAKPLVLFGIERRIARNDISTPEGRAQAANDALQVLAPIKDSILAKDYARQIASMLQLPEEDLIAELAKVRPPRRHDGDSMCAGEGASGAEAAPSDVEAPAKTYLAPQERNRMRTEREFLGLCAQNPAIAVQHAQAIEGMRWHHRASADIAGAMLATLLEDLSVSAPELIDSIQAKVPRSSSALTGAHLPEGERADEMISYLLEELQIGDMEQRLMLLRSQMGTGPDGEESDELFQESIELQGALSRMRDAHRLPE